MLDRIRKSLKDKDGGFTLIELLVVMIIIGILAAIAIPVFLSQRGKARDTSVKADVSTLGKETASYFVDGTGTLTLTQTAVSQPITLTDSAATPAYSTTMRVSSGTLLGTAKNMSSSTTWCVALSNAAGLQKTYYYSAATGLNAGTCP